MNQVSSVAFRVAVAAMLLCSGVSRIRAQEPAATPPTQGAPKQDSSKQDAAKAGASKDEKGDEEENENPFAPQPAPSLPPGMTGSDAGDARFKLTPGLYDAGESSMGMKHLQLVKKPDAFQLGSADADDPKVAEDAGATRHGCRREDAEAAAIGDRATGFRELRPCIPG